MPATVHVLNQCLLAPCKHTLLLLERQDVVQPHGVPIVSGGSRAADTSDDDPLSANTLRAPRRTTPSRTRACTTTSAATTSSTCIPEGRRCRPCQPRAHGWIKPVVHIVLQFISHSVPYAGTFGQRLKRGRYPSVCISHYRRPSSAVILPSFPQLPVSVRNDQFPTTRSQGSMFDSLSVIGLL